MWRWDNNINIDCKEIGCESAVVWDWLRIVPYGWFFIRRIEFWCLAVQDLFVTQAISDHFRNVNIHFNAHSVEAHLK
jgi:hypothetical protein